MAYLFIYSMNFEKKRFCLVNFSNNNNIKSILLRITITYFRGGVKIVILGSFSIKFIMITQQCW